MREYILRRLVAAIPVLLFVSFGIFILIRLIPGDPVTFMLENDPDPSPERVAAIKKDLGIDQPIWEQYVVWLGGVVRGDWGTSIHYRQPVLGQLAQRIPVTVELGLMAIVLSVLIALPLGVISAIYQRHWPDYLLRVISITGLAVPAFWLGTLIVVLPTVLFKVTPIMTYVPINQNLGLNLAAFIVPAAALGFGMSALVVRMVRSNLLEVFREDYVRTARAKGLAERVIIVRHALKNAMIPVITLIGGQAGIIIGGSVVIESVFNLPGVGRMTLQAISQRDYPQLQGNVLFLAISYILINIFVDVSYAWFDPRIRFR